MIWYDDMYDGMIIDIIRWCIFSGCYPLGSSDEIGNDMNDIRSLRYGSQCGAKKKKRSIGRNSTRCSFEHW